MSDVLVVGLAGRSNDRSWQTSLEGRRIYARSSTGVDAAITVSHTFDDLLDSDDLSLGPERIAEQLAVDAQTHRIAYLVSGWAHLGDATVEALTSRIPVTLLPDVLHSLPALASVTVIDALTLASAQMSEPFQAGLVPLDASQTIVVSNWYGETVTRRAGALLRASFGQEIDLQPNDDGLVTIVGRDRLAGSSSMAALRHIYARLRRPDGCPWDREQSELSTVPHIVEEADELREALEAMDWRHSADELGDILGNVLMIAQIAEERGRFTFEDVVTAVSEKLIRRHPHVFGDMQATTPDEVLGIWNTVKQQEREKH
jgi:uncharacterized protein YabN with tetrapyrrole methylase and pyrophosphatase domain